MKNINVCDAGAHIRSHWIPVFAGMTAKICGITMIVIAALFATPSFATPTEADKRTVASKAYVDTKQDKITTGLVEFDDYGTTVTVPALVLTNAAGTALNGNTIGFLDLNTYNNLDSGLDELPDTLVPSVGLLREGLNYTYNSLRWTSFGWQLNSFPAAINAYSVTFNGTTNNWPSNQYDYVVPAYTFVNSLALKQNKIATSGYYYNASGTATAYGNNSNANGWLHAGVKGTGIVTKTATGGVVGERKIFEASDVSNYHATGSTQFQQDIQDISIPTVGAVMSIVNTNAPTGTPGNVAMYDPSTGALGDGVATYSGATAQNPYNATNDAAKIATAAAVETKQTKRVCAGYEPGHENDPDYCWLWDFPD